MFLHQNSHFNIVIVAFSVTCIRRIQNTIERYTSSRETGAQQSNNKNTRQQWEVLSFTCKHKTNVPNQFTGIGQRFRMHNVINDGSHKLYVVIIQIYASHWVSYKGPRVKIVTRYWKLLYTHPVHKKIMKYCLIPWIVVFSIFWTSYWQWTNN